MANVLTVNLAHPRPNSDKRQVLTGIDKRPTDDTITVRAPGPMHGGLGSGLLGDFIGNPRVDNRHVTNMLCGAAGARGPGRHVIPYATRHNGLVRVMGERLSPLRR